LKLRETHQQHVQELNSLKTERSTMLIKITDLEEKLLEALLQIERLTDEKLTHMLSVQKSPTDKIGIRYVVSSSDISSISKIVFIKLIVPEPPHACMDKGKAVIVGEDLVVAELIQKPPTKKVPPICHHCGVSSHIRPWCPQHQAQKSKVKKEPHDKLHLALDLR
jgi:hypothetical protein